ncbi:Hypothetical predicted protein [Podarcis lilfordi]|uniref:Uncharacterized protein n=1 Tax=Podarcis lilfordi TaxID=74358 RepID=A0AA35K4X3_9SAUR|nr:Hypothetical predicted protein [Podarcis lilfordi]
MLGCSQTKATGSQLCEPLQCSSAAIFLLWLVQERDLLRAKVQEASWVLPWIIPFSLCVCVALRSSVPSQSLCVLQFDDFRPCSSLAPFLVLGDISGKIVFVPEYGPLPHSCRCTFRWIWLFENLCSLLKWAAGFAFSRIFCGA